ncbi:MAG TPA: hypothetical protein VJ506_12070, partial [Candidatus Limnocylindrales bacterium]|nr:hypothetical protein [Candidatus Limnocylindrales bacterium]
MSPEASREPGARAPDGTPAANPPRTLRQRLGSGLGSLGRSIFVPVLALFSALVIGAIVIALSDIEFLQKLGTDPGGAIGDALGSIGRAYGALIGGAIGDPKDYWQAIQSGDSKAFITAFTPLS